MVRKSFQKNSKKIRCSWCLGDPLYQKYHDAEWGVPVTNDRKLFDFLILEGAQAGLSWLTILKRRKNYRRAFAGFDPKRVARYSKLDIKRLLKNEGIIRNRLKVESAISNARAFLEVQREFGSFSKYMWQWVGEPRHNARRSLKDIPALDKISQAWSRDLKKRGFRFVGPTIVYAHMQAVGMVNDHTVICFRYSEIVEIGKTAIK